MSEFAATAHPAATVVLLRDAADGCEVLLVRRNAKLAFHGGAWVFPGGRIDPEDHQRAEHGAIEHAARYAAAREAREEAGLEVVPQDLLLFSRWLTPTNVAKRFDTWFFVGAVTSGSVQVDGGEIHDHRWFQPRQALAAQRGREIELPPPTFVTLVQLGDHPTVQSTLSALRQRPFEFFEPQLHFTPEGACTIYHGDAAYGSGGIEQPGARHRLWMSDSGWRYEREP
ncbi:MAG: NUDIX domain-containing protein [Deltaproteobacteria bacterium]|nr:NUDIX domain-containing protein [Deltaproteobacteria bacterium]